MIKMEMRFNGRKITSASQLEREIKRSMERHVEDKLKRAAGPGVRMKKKTRNGYVFEGTPEQIERMRQRLHRGAR